jgi:type II secretory pathway pseudopilin PulG
VVVLTLNNKGMTLIETLFAFSIYITVIVLFVSLLTKGLQTMQRLTNQQYLNTKEVSISKQNTLEEVIKGVLH